MDKRTALTTAGMIVLVVTAGGVAMGANLGILGATDPPNDVGELTPVSQPGALTTSTLPPEVETVYVDEFIGGSAPATFDDRGDAFEGEFEDEDESEGEDELDDEDELDNEDDFEDEDDEHEGRDDDD